MRTGYSKLHAQLPESGTWIVLGDVTIDIGKIKCLVTVGTDLAKLEERKDFTLSLRDLHIIGINPTESSTGKFAQAAFESTLEKVKRSGSLAALIIDQGSDVKNGGKLLHEKDSSVKIIYDLSHKLANVLEKKLTADPNWERYTKELTKTRRLVQQTEFSALMPPNQRSKARFMNAALYLDWPDRLLRSKREGRLKDVPEERYEQYFGWLKGYSSSLGGWGQMVGALELIKSVNRVYGLSEESYDYLLETIAQMPLEESVEDFIRDAFSSLYEEVEKLDEGQTIPAFTEALESLFGAHKNHTVKGGQGICGNILTIAILAGPQQTVDEICRAMEETPTSKVWKWAKEVTGNTVGRLRRRFFKGTRTKFDKPVFTGSCA